MVGRYFPETFYSSTYTINKSGTSTSTNEISRQPFESSKNTAESEKTQTAALRKELEQAATYPGTK